MSSSSSAIASPSDFLTYPAATPLPPTPPPTQITPQVLKDRLYVGNLHPTVDEYTLLQLFSKHGKVSKLDFLFHKSGPAKGKPRGYAFVEYATKDDALKALVGLHDRLVRGRRLVVTFAHQAPQVDASRPNRRPGTDTSRPTTLSLLKTHNRPAGTEDKIAALEAKLRQMEQKPESPASLTVLPSSLPQKPLLSTLPTVPAGGVQRKPGTSCGPPTGSGLRTFGPSTKGGSGPSLLRPSPSLSSSSTPVSTSNKAPLPSGLSSLPPKPGSVTGHRHSSGSLGIAIKR